MRLRMNEPREYTYFIDRDLGLSFSNVLLTSGLRFERADTHFKTNTPDDQWLPTVASRGWLAITRDARIRYSPLALAALMTSGARLFVIVGKLTTADSAAVFLHWRKKIDLLAATERGAFIAKVRRDGVRIWLNHAAWARRRR